MCENGKFKTAVSSKFATLNFEGVLQTPQEDEILPVYPLVTIPDESPKDEQPVVEDDDQSSFHEQDSLFE